MWKPRPAGQAGSIRARVLAIALIPSIAILVVGAVVSGSLINQGLQVHRFADGVRGVLGPTSRFVAAVQDERKLTMQRLSDRSVSRSEVNDQRELVDGALAEMAVAARVLQAEAPEVLTEALVGFERVSGELGDLRERVDSGLAFPEDVYDYFNELIEATGAGIMLIARSTSDAEVSFEQMTSYDLFRSAEAQARSHAMAVLGVTGDLDDAQFHELAHQLGMYHEQVEQVVSRLTDDERQAYAELKETASWKTLVAGDNSLMAQGPEGLEVSFDIAEWQASADAVGDALLGLHISHSDYAADLGTEAGNRALLTSFVNGALILLIALGAMVIALRLSSRLISRLHKLREDTLALAERELPDVMERLRQGDRINVEDQVPWLEHGSDEIGQVANAFNKAQHLAISAAVQEAETRKGVGSVFLNIAHRSQVIVHRQLKVLDEIERSVEDPDQLQLLFQLDHLATRSRRNAENLIILGGEQPGRRWRNPVSLREVVRSAVAETENYTRVNATAVPDAMMDGSVVADLAHLLAELVDNGTAFSPPDSRVEVRGNLVGRGVVVEIEDQGLGIDTERREEYNSMLRNPPDFSVMALSTESRVGMFVVAQLASRHGIRIALRESIYGGTTAIVLIPTAVMVSEEAENDMPALARIADHTSTAGPVAEVPAPRADSVPRSASEPPGGPTELPAIGSSWRTVIMPKPEVSASATPQAPHDGASADQYAWPTMHTDGATGEGNDRDRRLNGNGGRLNGAAGNGTSGHGAAGNGGGTNGVGRDGAPNHKPALPRRKRQEHLAPQLAEDPTGAAERTPAISDRPEPADEVVAERSRNIMSAFQNGTLRARQSEPDQTMNGHR